MYRFWNFKLSNLIQKQKMLFKMPKTEKYIPKIS